MNQITIEALTEFRFISDPRFSPDGDSIAFIAQQGDLEDNDYKGDLWLYSRRDEKTRRLTASGDVKSYTWTSEGTLLFPSWRDGKKEGATVYYQISPDGGEAVKAFELPLKVTELRSLPGGRCILKALDQIKEKAPGQGEAWEVIDEVPFLDNAKGFTNGLRTRLYLYEPGTEKLTLVSEKDADVGGYSVRGSRILYKAYPWTDVRNHDDGIYLYDMETNTNRCLLEKDTRRTGLIGFWAEDEAVVASCEDNPHGHGKYLDFYTMDLKTGQFRLLTEYDYSSGNGSVCSDARLGGGQTVKTEEGICYFVTTRGGSAQVYAIKRDGSLDGIVTDSGSCDSFDILDGHVAVCGLYGQKLTELYLDGKQVTQFNDMSRWQLSVPEPLTMTASDGYELTGWVMKPADYKPGQKYPAILHIHGGPRTVFGTVFHHEMQMWAGAGYFVFFTNPRGSDGFGTEFGDISGKYGTVDYDNLMEFTDYVLEQEPDIDRERVGVTGGSYGGFMTNWIIGHTNRFKAAVSQRSIASWISFEHMSDIGHIFTKFEQSVLTKEDAKKLWFHSPLNYAANCSTPTMFVHADQDYRCNIAEGIQMFTALKLLGVETRMLMVKGETHELSRSGRPRNRILRMKEILNWMDQHLKTEEAGKEA